MYDPSNPTPPRLSSFEVSSSQGPLVLFRRPLPAEPQRSAYVAFYRPILIGDRESGLDATAIAERLAALLAAPSRQKWAVLLAKGGHFAGAIFDFSKTISTAGAEEEPSVIGASFLALQSPLNLFTRLLFFSQYTTLFLYI